MIFTSYHFILLFFPIVTIGYWVLNRLQLKTAARIYLIAASFFFYAQGSPGFFPFFLGSVLGNYIIGTALCRLDQDEGVLERKLLLITGLAGNLGLLGYYKYMNFFLENVRNLTGIHITIRQIALPIGISFFTFQLIAYLVDCYRGKTREYSMIEYLLFITFFPQLIVGPIVHHAEITPQFEKPENNRLNYRNIALGIFIFSIGCAKKMIFADPMNSNAAAYFNNLPMNLKMWESWFYTLEYCLSYYFDLSGYTDMAIGIALFYNIRLPENFDAPWKARNMQQYWQRQHMTLSRFLGGYVFKNVFRKGCWWRNYYVATMVTFLVSGIWHGAGWNFILWGIMNGVLVCIGAWENYHEKHPPYVLGVFLTYLCIILTRVIFVAKNMTDALRVYRSMFDVAFVAENGVIMLLKRCYWFALNHKYLFGLVVIAQLVCWFAPTTKQMAARFRPNVKWALFAGGLMAFCLAQMNQVVQFLYFQF